MDKIYDSLMQESLNTAPGEAEVYSDLSFITLQMVVGTIALKNDLVSRDSFLPQCEAMLISRERSNDDPYPVSVVCAFESFVRQNVFQRPDDSGEPWLKSTSYLPPERLYPRCAPTMNDTGANMDDKLVTQLLIMRLFQVKGRIHTDDCKAKLPTGTATPWGALRDMRECSQLPLTSAVFSST